MAADDISFIILNSINEGLPLALISIVLSIEIALLTGFLIYNNLIKKTTD